MKRIFLTTAMAFAVSNGSAENLQMDPKDLMEDMAEQYIKNISVPLPKIADIDLPDGLQMGLKESGYQFDSGTSVQFRTRDPLAGVVIQQGNQNYQITQDSLTWSFSKTLNRAQFDRPDLQKFID